MLTKPPRSSFFARNMDMMTVLWGLALFATRDMLYSEDGDEVVCQDLPTWRIKGVLAR